MGEMLADEDLVWRDRRHDEEVEDRTASLGDAAQVLKYLGGAELARERAVTG